MNGLTREEVNASIRANNAEVDARLNAFNGRFDVLGAKVEAETHKVISEVQTAKVETLKWAIGVVVAMQAVSIYLHNDMGQRVSQLSARVEQLSTQLQQLSTQVQQLSTRTDQLSGQVQELNSRMTGVETRLARNEKAKVSRPEDSTIRP